MSHQEKNILASLTSSIVTFSVYALITSNLYQDGRFALVDGNSFLGKAILLLILGGVISNIVITILFNIIFAVVQNEPKPSFVVDERDDVIELKGKRFAINVIGIGMIIAMIALARDGSIFLVFNLLIAAFALSDISSNIFMFVLHRKGL